MAEKIHGELRELEVVSDVEDGMGADEKYPVLPNPPSPPRDRVPVQPSVGHSTPSPRLHLIRQANSPETMIRPDLGRVPVSAHRAPESPIDINHLMSDEEFKEKQRYLLGEEEEEVRESDDGPSVEEMKDKRKGNDAAPQERAAEPVPLRRSTRSRVPTQLTNLDYYQVYGTRRKLGIKNKVLVNEVPDREPCSVGEALQHGGWKRAMDEEMKAMKDNKVFELVMRPQNATVITNKWVFKLKKNEKGEIVKRKARLVARGFNQIAGMDYDDIFAPVARIASLRVLLALAARLKMTTRHMDVVTAFLHGDIDIEQYMECPEGFSEKEGDYVWKLRKAIYGLKQASKCWHDKIKTKLSSMGFRACVKDPGVYVLRRGTSLIYIWLYVDDMIVFSMHASDVTWVKKEIEKMVELKDLGEVRHVLNVRVSRLQDGSYVLNQANYIEQILKECGLSDIRSATTPYPSTAVLRKRVEGEASEKEVTEYRSIVGELNYLANVSRPDIQYVVSSLQRFANNPGPDHWKVLEHTLRFLSKTKAYGLVMRATGSIAD